MLQRYINYNILPDNNAILYADDLIFLISSPNNIFPVLQANHFLSEIATWTCAKKLSINAEKSKYVFFTCSKQNQICKSQAPVGIVNGSSMEGVESINYLGVTFHSNLSLKLRMNKLRAKLRVSICKVAKASHRLNQQSLVILYHAMIASHWRYCITTRCFDNMTVMVKVLQNLCNKFLKLVFDHKKTPNLNKLLLNLNF